MMTRFPLFLIVFVALLCCFNAHEVDSAISSSVSVSSQLVRNGAPITPVDKLNADVLVLKDLIRTLEQSDKPAPGKKARELERLREALDKAKTNLKALQDSYAAAALAKKEASDLKRLASKYHCKRDMTHGYYRKYCKNLFCRIDGLFARSKQNRAIAQATWKVYNQQLKIDRIRARIQHIKQEQEWRAAHPNKADDERDWRENNGEEEGGIPPSAHRRARRRGYCRRHRGGNNIPGRRQHHRGTVEGWNDQRLKVELGKAQQRLAKAEEKLKALIVDKVNKELALIKSKKELNAKCPPMNPPPPKPRKPFGFCTAHSSGDPHTTTWDGHVHHTMTAGWFTYAKNKVIDLQGFSQLGCMPPQYPNTCMRSAVLRIRPPDTNEELVVSWGNWPPTGQMHNVMIRDSTGSTINVHPHHFRGGVFLNGKYSIRFAHGQLRVSPHGKHAADPELAVSMTIGTYFLALTLPHAEPHLGHTNGIFGFFTGHRGHRNFGSAFRNHDGSQSQVNGGDISGGGMAQFQGGHIRRWAATHVVGPHNPPIGFAQSLRQIRYLNSYYRHEAYHGFLQTNSTVHPDMLALMEVSNNGEGEFDPEPKSGSFVVLDAHEKPESSPQEVAFCKAMLKPLFSKHDITKPGKHRDQYKKNMVSCLADAPNPKVARTIAKCVKTSRKQQKKSAKACKKQVKKINVEIKQQFGEQAFQDTAKEDADAERIAEKKSKYIQQALEQSSAVFAQAEKEQDDEKKLKLMQKASALVDAATLMSAQESEADLDKTWEKLQDIKDP